MLGAQGKKINFSIIPPFGRHSQFTGLLNAIEGNQACA